MLALFFNAVAYLLGFKAIEIFTSIFLEYSISYNGYWGIIIIEFFFNIILNWILILLTPLIFIFYNPTKDSG
jgi:hypothetical protein